ncbi:peptidase S16, partial [Russula aff. rugulosa BPL654]
MGKGELMPIESTATAAAGNGNPRLTGSLGDVIGSRAYCSWVKTHAYDLSTTIKRVQDPLRIPDVMNREYVDLPAAAKKKDGPSGSVAMVCAIVSLFTGNMFPPTTVILLMKITLRGRVSPHGGIKEKGLGAHRAGANRVILPWANRKDVEY